MLLLAACGDPDPIVEAPPLPPHRVFPTAADALRAVLASNPRVLGVGEVHATTDGPAVPTTLSRFTRELLPVLAPHTTDLVIETWRLDGRCGAQEEKVATQVDADAKRPEAAKDDIVLLAEAAVAAGVRPHDLAITCDEYAGLLDANGEVVYASLLTLLSAKLQDYAVRAIDTPDATMVLYGGAVHNDLFPSEALAAYSYGPAVRAKGGAAYVELDLYAPELLGEAMIEPAWAPLLATTGPDQVALYERGDGSYVLLLERRAGP